MFPVAILAGGLATRLRPLTEGIPKALIDINGEPFVVHQLRLLRRSGIERVVFCIGHLGEQIVKVVGDGESLGLQVAYSFDGPRLLGTAGAIKRALPQLGDSFFVLYGDSYLECDYGAVQGAFEKSVPLPSPFQGEGQGGVPRQATAKLGLMTVYRNDGRWDTSNVEFTEGRIVAYDKRNRTPRMQHIDYGLGVFHRLAFDRVPENQPCDLEFVYQDLLRKGQLAAFEVSQRFYEVGSLSGIEELARHLREPEQVQPMD